MSSHQERVAQGLGSQRVLAIQQHDASLTPFRERLKREKNAARLESHDDLERLKSSLPQGLYQDVCIPMAANSLENTLRKIDQAYEESIRPIKEHFDAEMARLDRESIVARRPQSDESFGTPRLIREPSKPAPVVNANHIEASTKSPEGEAPRYSYKKLRKLANSAVTPTKKQRNASSAAPKSSGSGHQSTAGSKQSRKRRASEDVIHSSKKLRVDTSVHSLQTPVATPSVDDNDESLPRTITFNEVYQDGKARHKDAIIEWPFRSGKWYILKCEEHGVHFRNKNSPQGAAKHLNGAGHGVEGRSQDNAVKVLGYLVTDCTAELVKVNNDVVDKAYAEGYEPMNLHAGKRACPSLSSTSGSKTQQKPQVRKESVKEQLASASSSVMDGSQNRGSARASPSKEKKAEIRSHPQIASDAIDWEKSSHNSQSSTTLTSKLTGIFSPKTFHIYNAYWRGDDRVYPVLILGWDDLTPGGLKRRLSGTGLLEKHSSPPGCYIYESNKIVGWAPRFRDGGSKFDMRKFPVMFFDQRQSVGWVMGKHLSKFPLYKRSAPEKYDNPFNAARRWIAEREGFATWEAREAERKKRVSGDASSSATPWTTPSGVPIEKAHVDADDYDDSDLDFDGLAEGDKGSAKEPSEELKELKELLRRGGEIPGDGDYQESESESTSSNEMNEETYGLTDQHAPASAERPWEFYQFRPTTDESRKKSSTAAVANARESEQTNPRTSAAPRSTLDQRPTQSALKMSDAFFSALLASVSAVPGGTEPNSLEPKDILKPYESGVAEDVKGPAPPSSGVNLPSFGASSPKNKGYSFSQAARFLEAYDDHFQRPRKAQSEGPAAVESKTTAAGQAGAGRAASLPAATESKNSLVLKKLTSLKTVEQVKSVEEVKPVKQVEPAAQVKLFYGTKSKESMTGPPHANITEDAVERIDPSVEANGASELKCEVKNSQGEPRGGHGQSIDPGYATQPSPVSGTTADQGVNTTEADDGEEVEAPSRNADYEISSYSNGIMSWSRPESTAACVKLFCSDDGRKVHAFGDKVKFCIKAAKISRFSRKIIPGSTGNSVLSLIPGDEDVQQTTMKLVFDRSPGSTVMVGKIQQRGFIRWLRSVKPDIRCLD